MDEQTIIKTLTENGGKLWEKNGMRRIYFDSDTVLAAAGYRATYYKTGNVCNATLDGEYISNSHARSMEWAFSGAKLWYDLSNGTFNCRGDLRGWNYIWKNFSENLKALIS